MSALRRASALTGLLVALGLFAGCKPGVGGLYLSVSAEPGTGPATALVMRALVAADGGDLRFEHTYDLGGRDLTVEAFVIRVEPEGFPSGTEARVSLVASRDGDAVAAYGGRQIVSDERVLDVVLTARDAACDVDGDGYAACERADCCLAEDATDFSDCDDANASAHPFAATAACRACGSGCGGTDGDDASDVEAAPEVPDDAPDADAADADALGPIDAAEPPPDAETADVAPEHADALPDEQAPDTTETVDVGEATDTADTADVPDACLPDCSGKACGDDGCGGSCGGCTNGKTCTSGQCVCAGTTDDDCDNVDDDCDGQTDESYLPVSTACGTGACAATGKTSCANGFVQDSCTPAEPTAGEARCDGVDDDCDGATDEGCDDDGDDYCDEAMTVIGAPAACPKGAGDCYDQNVLAYPDQPGWFAGDRGDGSYDYDCSSSEEREKNTLGSCQYLVLDCKLAEQGWDDGSIAACGETEAWLQDCAWQVSCGHQTTPVTQRCH